MVNNILGKMEKEKLKRMLRTSRYFSEDFRKQKVKEIEQNLIKVSELSKLYGISRTSIYKWIYQYSLNLKKGIVQVIEMESETRKNKLLQARLAELERIIGQKQLQIDYLEKVIEISSEDLGTDIKKKYSTELLNGSENTNADTK